MNGLCEGHFCWNWRGVYTSITRYQNILRACFRNILEPEGVSCLRRVAKESKVIVGDWSWLLGGSFINRCQTEFFLKSSWNYFIWLIFKLPFTSVCLSAAQVPSSWHAGNARSETCILHFQFIFVLYAPFWEFPWTTLPQKKKKPSPHLNVCLISVRYIKMAKKRRQSNFVSQN